MEKNDSAAVQIMSDGLGKGASSGGVMMGSSYQSSFGSAYQQTHYSSGGTGKAGSSGSEQMAMRVGSDREIVKMTPHESEQMHQEMHTYRTSDAQPVKYSSGDMGKAGPSGYEQMAGFGGSDGGVLMRKTPHGSEPVYPQSQGFGEIDAQAAKYRSGDMGKAGSTGTEQIMSFDSMDRREYINTDGLQQIIQNLTSIKQRLTSFSDSQRALKENMHRAWNGTTGDKAYEKLNKYENKYNKYIKMVNKRIRFLRYVIDQYTIWENEINQKIDDNFSKKM